MKATLLVLCALVALAASASQKFRYQPGKTYSYDYTVQTETGMDGASEDKAIITITGQADIEVIDQCDLVLKLKSMNVYESKSGSRSQSPRSSEFRRTLERSPLRFSFQDGVVAELCPDRQEDGWALNVKRGVLSALQNSMDKLEGAQDVKETDVTGRCQAKYEVTNKGWYTTTVKRTKDLLACTDRHGYSGSLQTSPYHVATELQSVPLMKSNHECEQEVSKEGILKSSTCTERHLFRPFSAENSGALTSVTQSLKYTSERHGIRSEKDIIHSRADLPFDHSYGIRDSSEARVRTEELLIKLCDVTLSGIRPEVPRLFSQLVGTVQKMDQGDIVDIYRQLKRQAICSNNNQRTKKFFLDALPMAGTSQAVSLMTQLMVSEDISGVELDLWLTALAFIPEPSDDMLRAAKSLLDADKLKEKAMLPVSAMVNNYCKSRPGCSDEFEVEGIMASLEKNIGYSCYVTDSNIKTVLLAVKALGNTGQARAASVLNRCLADRLPTEVRVEAAQAYRRMPCDTDKSKLTELFRDASEDAEIRIAAFLQLMNCPSKPLLDRVQIVMESEPEDSQVGSFMYTHLSNLMETSSPHKQDIRQLVRDFKLQKEFQLNPLKFSRNYEKSLFLKMFNTGAQGESNVIFSAQSPLPRSINANLTFDLFGHSVNVMELGGRLEGIEYLLETVLGPYSLFGDGNKNNAKDKLDELKGSMYARIFGNELAYNRFQGMKSLTSGKTFNLLDFLIKLSKDHDYSFTQSLQFLDSSITVPTACGLPLTLAVNATATVDVRATGKMDLRKVQSSPRSIYVDGELRPSGAVNVDGVMSVDALVARTGLKVSGSMHSSMALKGRVDLDRGRVLSVQLDMPDDRQDILDIRTQFFILSSDDEKEQKMITENRKEHEVCTGDMVAQVTGLEVCGQLSFPNASMKESGPYFPLTGPASFSVILHKRDSHSGYKLLAKRVENKRSSIAQLSFDTPGSSVVRAVSFDMMVDYSSREAEISFASPWKKSTVKGSLVNDAGLKSVTGSLVVDDKDTYSVTSEVKVEDKDKVVIYSPVLEIRRPGAQTISLKGNAEVDVKFRTLSTALTLSGVTNDPVQLDATYKNTQSEKSAKYTVTHGKSKYSAQAGVTYDIRNGKNVFAQFEPLIVVSTPRGQLVNVAGTATYRGDKSLKADLMVDIPDVLDKPISVKTGIIKKSTKRGPRFDVDLLVKSRPFTTKVKGTIKENKGLKQARLTIDYNVLRVRDRISLSGKFSDKSTAALRKYTLISNVDFKRNPDWNVQVGLDFDHKKRRSEAELTLKLGKDTKDKDKHIILSGSINRKISSLSQMDIDFKAKAFAPMMGVDTLVTGGHSHAPDTLQSKVSVTYDKSKSVEAGINLRDKSDDKLRMMGDASLAYPGAKFHLDTTLIEKKPGLYVHTLEMKDKAGELASVKSNYKGSKGERHEADTAIVLRGVKPIKASGSTSLDLDNLQLESQVMHGEDSYGLQAMSKLSRGPRGKWTFEAHYPSRKVALTANGGLLKGSLNFDLDVAWDKDRDNKAKITLEVDGKHKESSGVSSTNGKLEFTSPFKALDYMSASVSYDNDKKRYGLDGKMTVGDKSNTISSVFNVAKPVSPRELHVTWTGSSPFKGYQRMEASLDHTMNDRSISCSLKGSKGRTNGELTITGLNNGDRYNTDLKGDLKLRSNVDGVEDISVSAAHSDDGRRYQSQVAFEHNGNKYSSDLDMTHYRRDWQVQNNGQLKLASPRHDFTTSWQHRNTDGDVSSTLTSNWDRKQLKVVLTGDHKLRDDKRVVSGALKIQSPWQPVSDVAINLNHEAGDRQCTHSAEIVREGRRIASTGLNYNLGDRNADFDVSVTSPFHHDISGKVNGQFDDYPETAHVEVTWSPRHTVTADASVVKADNDGIEGNLRLSSPFLRLRSLVAKGSMTREGEELVTKASLDYGVRKSFDIDTRLRLETLSLARVKINTPYEEYRTFDAGYQFSGDFDDFDANADFAIQPVLGKYNGIFTLETDSDISAKLRINTPHRDLQYMQLTATSQDTTGGRQSRVELDYYPRQIYSVQSLYSLSMPIVFSVSVETPIAGYDSFAASMSHQATDSSILTHGEVQYLPEKTIESTLNLRWEREVDGSLVVKTPFEKFEESKLSIRHEGDLEDFTSHAQLEVARKSMSADAKFKSGYTTVGTVTVTSPWKTMEASVNKKGDLDNFRSGAYLTFGDQKIEGALNHRLNSRVLKTKATLSTPFTEDMEASVDFSNRNGDIQAEMGGNYGPSYSVKSESKLLIGQPDISGDSSLTYKMGGRAQVIKVSASKKGDWDDVELMATASSPYTEDASLSVKHFHRLPYSVKNTVSGNYGQRYSIVSDGKYDKRLSDITGSYTFQYKLDSPVQEISLTGSKRGDLSNLNIDVSAKTPFPGFETMSTVLAYAGSDNGFSSDGTIEYMTGKKIQEQISFSLDGLNQVRMDASLTTPIPAIGRTVVKINHDRDDYRKVCAGSAQISSSALGNHQLTYKKTGDISSMTGEMSVMTNGKAMEGSFTRVPLTNGYKHAIVLKGLDNKLDAAAEYEMTGEKVSGKASASSSSHSLSIEGEASMSGRQAGISGTMTANSPDFRKTASISLNKDGHYDHFTMDARGSYDNKEATAHAEFKNQGDDLSGKVTLTTPITDFTNIGASFDHNGDGDRFVSGGKVTYMDGKEIAGKVNFYRYQWRRIEVSTELTTPFAALRSGKAQYRHQGSSDSFTCSASVEYDDQKISSDLRTSMSPKYDASLTIKTPFDALRNLVAEATMESLANTHSLRTSLDLGRGSRYGLSGNLDMDSIPMTASGQLTTPFEMLRNVEISGSHQGEIDDFSSNVVFNSPMTDTIRGDVAVRYGSPVDLSASAALKSEIEGMEDLMLEVRNTESGDTKSSHVTVRWAPEQQITADGSYVKKDYWYNKQIQADLSVTTPFSTLRSGNMHLEHANANNKYSPKAELIINGESKLDIDAEYNHGDSPSASITARKPWPMQLTSSMADSGDSKEGDVYLNWNRDELDKNIRIQTKAMHVKDDYQRNMDYSVKVVHPSRTVSGGWSLVSQQSKITSQGHVAWDQRDQSKVFYELELVDGSQYTRKNYEGSVKLGVPSRTLEASGAITAYRQTSTVDGSFSWDAQRDPTKQVGFNAKVTSGEKNKADVTFRLPAIGKEVRIDSEMEVNQGRTMWDGKTALSYSPDSRKTITLSSSLKDVSESSYYSEGKNYSLSLAISHPYTDVDVSLTSHLGAIGDRYSTAMSVDYLTARRQRKNVALRGEIDRLRRQIDLQLVSPIKTMSMQGKVKSTDPYIVTLTNADEQGSIQSEINVNPTKRSVLVQTNYDAAYPDNKLVLRMEYVNDSAVKAELYEENRYKAVSDGLLAARLNTSRLLHTRLAWRTTMLTDLQAFVQRKGVQNAHNAKEMLQDAVEAVGQEVTAKYAAIADEVSSELRPLVGLLEGEFARLGQQLDDIRTGIKRMYKKNDFYLQDMGQSVEEGVKKLRLKLYDISAEYQESYASLLSSIEEQLREIRSYPIQQKYREAVAELVVAIEESIEEGLVTITNAIAQIDDYLYQLVDGAQERWEEVKNHPHVQNVQNRMDLLGHDYRWLMGHLGERVRQVKIPEEYTNAIYNARDSISSGLSGMLERQEVQKFQAAANEVYQQGVWAYKYWQVEENMEECLASIVRLVKKLIEQELEFITEKVDFLRKSKVTVYDPEDGEIQVEIVLPVPLESLSQMPDIQSYIDEAQNAVNDYLPAKETVVDLYTKYAPAGLWGSNATNQSEDDIMSQFQVAVIRVNKD
nr:hypothetical protein BaRGS_001577 [Batillaria attramentaria]